MIGKEYYVFLHRPFEDASSKLKEIEPDPKWCVLQGPAGIRPIATEYVEYKEQRAEKLEHETISHSNWVAAIRRFASETKKVERFYFLTKNSLTVRFLNCPP